MTEPPPPSARDVIEQLDLAPHPEGGHYRETWRGAAGPDGRAGGTAILFLLAVGERSHWHRVDAAEVWLHHQGDPVDVSIADTDRSPQVVRLGPTAGVAGGAVPQAIVPPHAWQAAEPVPAGVGWSLVSCVVVPGFEFDGFELAPNGWTPGRPDARRAG